MFALFPWWKIAAAGMILVALAGGAWKLRHGGLVAGRAEVQAEWTAEKLAMSETARLREQAAQKSNERIDREYQTAKTRLVADKRVTDDSLRELQAALKPGNAASATSGTDDPRDTIIDSCAAALVGMDEYAKGVALKAVGLQGYAREVCMSN